MIDLLIIIFVIIAALAIIALAYNDLLIELEDNIIKWIFRKDKYLLIIQDGKQAEIFAKFNRRKNAKQAQQKYFKNTNIDTKIKLNWN